MVESILIIKYQSWCTLTFLKCVKNGKLCQNATLTCIYMTFFTPGLVHIQAGKLISMYASIFNSDLQSI